jgi:hypothetical protein
MEGDMMDRQGMAGGHDFSPFGTQIWLGWGLGITRNGM